MKIFRSLSFLIPAGTFVISIVYLIGCLDLTFGTTSEPREGFVPYILGSFIFVGSFVLMIDAILKGRKMATSLQKVTRGELKNVLILIGVLVGYVVLLPILGFVICIFVLVVASTKIMGVRWRTIILLAVSTTVVTYLIFIYWLQVPLPSSFFM